MKDPRAEAEAVAELAARLQPVLEDVGRRAEVADGIIDRDLYRILISTVWVNVVMDPEAAGLQEAQLETLHDLLNQHITEVLGQEETLTSCFRYLNGKAGERAMKQAQLTANHRDLLLYFASIILDPDGHRRWMDEIRTPPSR